MEETLPTKPATVHRLRPRGRRQAELLQEALDLGGWPEPVRVALVERLTLRSPEPELWRFWNAIAPFVRRDTGEIVCTQRRLAKTAAITQGNVASALKRLVEIGALERLERGQYRVHPRLMWKGELAKREAAEKLAPPLQLVEPA
jgi:hypothetical protein